MEGSHEVIEFDQPSMFVRNPILVLLSPDGRSLLTVSREGLFIHEFSAEASSPLQGKLLANGSWFGGGFTCDGSIIGVQLQQPIRRWTRDHVEERPISASDWYPSRSHRFSRFAWQTEEEWFLAELAENGLEKQLTKGSKPVNFGLHPVC